MYAATGKGALSLTGSLVLDAAGDPSTVFIFQTDTTLTTATASTVSLINGAQECNVFWQVGSSATLGTSSVFTGSVMALASVTVNSGAVVHGRTLARNGAVTLDGNTFVAPTCATATTTTTTAPTTKTTAPVILPTTTTTVPAILPTTTTTSTLGPTTTTTTIPATTTTPQASPAVTPTPTVLEEQVTATTGPAASSQNQNGENSQELPRTGGPFAPLLVTAIMGGLLITALGAARSTPER